MRLIDADHFRDRVTGKVEANRKDGNSLISNILLEILAVEVDNEPTVDTLKHGHWIGDECNIGDMIYICSACKEEFILETGTPEENLYNYCPNCGAKMDEVVTK